MAEGQKDCLAPGAGHRQDLFFADVRRIRLEARLPLRKRPGIGSASTMQMIGTPGFGRVGAHSQAENRLTLPIPRIVLRTELATPGIIRDLVAIVSSHREACFDLAHHVGGLIFIAAFDLASGQGSAKGCLRLEGQFVGRNVFGLPIEKFLEISSKVRLGLRGAGEDQVDREIVEAGRPGGFEGLAGDGCAMGPTEPFQKSIVEGLNANRKPVDADGPKVRQARLFDSARIQLERRFERARSAAPGRRESLFNRFEDLAKRNRRKERRCPTPEVHTRERSALEIGPTRFELRQQTRRVASLRFDPELRHRYDRKITIRTDPLTEWQMEINPDRSIIKVLDPDHTHPLRGLRRLRAVREVGHRDKLAGSRRSRASCIRLGYSRRALSQNTTTDQPRNPALNPVLHRVLSNGLTMLLRESHRSPVVELQIWAGVGSADERPGEEGLAHFHEHMLFKGTERRGVGAVAGDIEGLGGHINAYTSFDATVYHATLPRAAWREGLDVLTDAVRFSIFDEEEIAREREVVLEEIRRSEDTPGHVLGELAFAECYKAHPYGLPILGPASNVAAFDRAQVREFFERWYTPDNLMVVATGDFDSQEVAEEIERLFAGAVAGKTARSRPDEPRQESMRITVLRKPFEGHRVDLSWPASNFRNRDSTHLDLLAYVLGECESSRLIRRIREGEALVDRIDASAYTPLDRGLFSIGFETDARRLLDATRRIVEETDRLRHTPVSEAELERARVNFLASDQFDRESVSGVASKLGSFEAMGGGWQCEAEALETLRTATPEDLLRVAQQYLVPEALTIAALIPESTDAALDEAAIRQAVSAGLEAATTARPEADEHDRSTQSPVEDPGSQRLRFAPMRTAADGAGERLDATLSNGLDLHVLRRPEVPIVAVRMATLGGLLCEDEANSGLTRFLAAMWSRGTQTHDSAAFARQIEGLAADVDGFSGRNSIGITLDCLSETLEPAFEYFADAILEPRFEEEEIERERRETLAAFERRADRLGQRAFQLFAETEFEDHPYRLTVLGEPESVSRLTRDDLKAHSQRLLQPQRAAISVVGDVDPEKIARLVERRFGSMQTGKNGFELPAEETRNIGIRESELIKDRAQAHLVIGFRGLTLGDPDRFALELISQILAGQGGRLFLELRDRQSLAYTVSASNVEGLAPGYFSLYIATAPEKLDRARAGIFEEIERLVSVAPSQEELEHAIRFGTGSFAIDSQRSHGRAAHIALDSIYGLGPDHTEAYPDAIARITPDDVLRVAQRIFRLDAYSTCAVHP